MKNGRKELEFEDFHHNTTELISFAPGTTELSVISEGEVALNDTHGVIGAHRGPAPLWLYLRETDRTRAKAGARSLLRGIEAAAPTLEGLHALADGIRAAVKYEVGSSHPEWSAEGRDRGGAGACARITPISSWPAPARWARLRAMCQATSCWMTRPCRRRCMPGPRRISRGLGWVGFDVSNGISPDTRYVRVATGLDYGDASPVSGSRVGGTGETLEVQIDVAQQ